MNNIETIVDSINRSNTTVYFSSNTFSLKMLPDPPVSFYKCFGAEADPNKELKYTKGRMKFLNFITNDKFSNSPINFPTKIILQKLLEEGFEDVEYFMEFRRIRRWNAQVERNRDIIKGDGSVEFSCSVFSNKNGNIVLRNPSSSLYYLLSFDQVASNIKTPEGMIKVELCPTELKKMESAYNEKRFFADVDGYENLVSYYDNQGYYDNLKLETSVMNKVNVSKIYLSTLRHYSYNMFAHICEFVDRVGG